MKKIISLIIITFGFSLLSLNVPPQAFAGPCCPQEFAVDIDGFSIGNQPTYPLNGRCYFADCHQCLTRGSCNPGWLASVTGMNPTAFREYCARGTIVRPQYICQGADPANPVDNPGEACDEVSYQCVPLRTIPQTAACEDGGGAGTCVNTALGTIRFNYELFINQVIRIGLGIGAGLAFLLIIYGSFKLVMSKGNPDAINEGKDTITSAIVGLVLIIFSVTVLQVIGIDILGLDALGL